MNQLTKATGIALALAAASLTGCQSTGGSSMVSEVLPEGTIKCFGANSCKGLNDCKSADNACKGHASCAGEGFLHMSKSACAQEGGTVG